MLSKVINRFMYLIIGGLLGFFLGATTMFLQIMK